MKLKGKYPEERQGSRWELAWKEVMQKEGRMWGEKKILRGFLIR
jgi:hypothetical protein